MSQQTQFATRGKSLRRRKCLPGSPRAFFLHYGLSSLPFSAVTDAASVRP